MIKKVRVQISIRRRENLLFVHFEDFTSLEKGMDIGLISKNTDVLVF